MQGKALQLLRWIASTPNRIISAHHDQWCALRVALDAAILIAVGWHINKYDCLAPVAGLFVGVGQMLIGGVGGWLLDIAIFQAVDSQPQRDPIEQWRRAFVTVCGMVVSVVLVYIGGHYGAF